MCRHFLYKILFASVLIVLALSCAEQRKIQTLKTSSIKADVGIISERESEIINEIKRGGEYVAKERIREENVAIRDLRGNRIIMNAVKDDKSGEMVATDVLNEVVVEATFRNIAERNGMVDIAFEIVVPSAMQDPAWQVRFSPIFFVNNDTLNLDELHITGTKYRAAQLKGYELYNKFLNSIISDSCDFIDSFCYKNLLDIFIDRNFKQLSRLRTDSTIIDTTITKSLMGVTEKETIEHYTKSWLVTRNNKKKMMRESMFKRYVKSPLIKGGVRLDSVITCENGAIKYHYVQTIKTVKELKKVEMVMDGGIYKEGKRLYIMPQTLPLVFYISSISAFTDTMVRYVKSIVERNVNVNTVAYIDFKIGKYNVNDTLSDNFREIARIKNNINDLFLIEDYVVDSLIVIASCSPEGKFESNIQLARDRAYSIKKYFADYISRYTDSIRNSIWDIDLLGIKTNNIREIDIKTKWIGEEWSRLESLIQSDTNIIDLSFIQKCFTISDLDLREKALQGGLDYKYIRSVLYPYLRTVKFDFFLHRKGMVKDTIHTTEIDTAYMSGLQAMHDRDYKLAIDKLRPYNDYNTAVAYVCLDYNKSALSILEHLPKNAKRDYMLAVVYSRLGDEKKAVEMYIHACEEDSAMRFRGNLDPEISVLIKKYGINKE